MTWGITLAFKLDSIWGDLTDSFSSWFAAGFFFAQSVMASCRVCVGFKWPHFVCGEDSFFVPVLKIRV